MKKRFFPIAITVLIVLNVAAIALNILRLVLLGTYSEQPPQTTQPVQVEQTEKAPAKAEVSAEEAAGLQVASQRAFFKRAADAKGNFMNRIASVPADSAFVLGYTTSDKEAEPFTLITDEASSGYPVIAETKESLKILLPGKQKTSAAWVHKDAVSTTKNDAQLYVTDATVSVLAGSDLVRIFPITQKGSHLTDASFGKAGFIADSNKSTALTSTVRTDGHGLVSITEVGKDATGYGLSLSHDDFAELATLVKEGTPIVFK